MISSYMTLKKCENHQNAQTRYSIFRMNFIMKISFYTWISLRARLKRTSANDVASDDSNWNIMRITIQKTSARDCTS